MYVFALWSFRANPNLILSMTHMGGWAWDKLESSTEKNIDSDYIGYSILTLCLVATFMRLLPLNSLYKNILVL